MVVTSVFRIAGDGGKEQSHYCRVPPSRCLAKGYLFIHLHVSFLSVHKLSMSNLVI